MIPVLLLSQALDSSIKFPIILNEVGNEEEFDIEKALFGLFRGILRPLTAFKGLKGSWVTHRGRPLFLKLQKQTIFNVAKDIPQRDVDLIKGIFNNFPDAVKNNVTILRIRGSQGLTSKLSKKELQRISTAKEDFFDIVTSQGGEYNNATGVLTLWPESTRVARKVGGKAIADIGGQTIRELQNHEGGHALFRGIGGDVGGLRSITDFAVASSREGGVSTYSQLFRNFLIAGTQRAKGQTVSTNVLSQPMPKDIPVFGTSEFFKWEGIQQRVFATENFAETYKIYLGRTGRRKADWLKIRKDKPGTIKTFLDILEGANAK